MAAWTRRRFVQASAASVAGAAASALLPGCATDVSNLSTTQGGSLREFTLVAQPGRVSVVGAPHPDTAAQASWTACHGLVSLLIMRPGFDWRPTEELLAATLDAMFHGLVAD